MKLTGKIWRDLTWQIRLIIVFSISLALVNLVFLKTTSAYTPPQPVNPQTTGIGLTGSIPSTPPTSAATIAVPSNGQTFTSLPITVQGICKTGLIIELYINNIFEGSADCINGSYSITSGLFNGTNNLVVYDYDNLNQQGPASNTVTITYNNPNVGAAPGLSITSNYSKLGAQPGSVLSWPIIINGGDPPYALSVDWGDGSSPSLISQASPGTLNIKHTYASAGIYTILIKITDSQGNVAYLQLVGVATGATSQSTSTTKLNSPKTSPSKGIKLNNTTLYIILVLITILPAVTFWLGSRHRLASIKTKLKRGEGL